MTAVLKFIQSPEFYLPIIYICIGILVHGIVCRVLEKAVSIKVGHLSRSSGNYKKSQTVLALSKAIVKYVVIMITILSILTVYGVNVASILAGLGLLGAVIGLALQDILKDVFAGIGIILENQYAIGDNIEIDHFRGEVISLGLKTTKVKNYQGAIKVFANRNITEVINYSLASSLAIVDVSVAYEEDLKKVEKVLTDLAEELSESLENLEGPVEVLGITDLSDSSIVYRLTVETRPVENFQIERQIRRAIKDRFEAKKIKIPYPQIEVHHGNK